MPTPISPSVPVSASVAPARAGTPRLGGLDLVRGVMLVASVSVNSLFTEPEWFAHAAWGGVHPVDLIFPVFVTLTGCGLGFALHRRVQIAPLIRRVLVLLLVGLVY
ncbi:MAG: hypothetical protein Q7T71_08635, partial [Herbiconiux sp.]|nr:hypothetical protein [Herbiconiux sp.]